MRYQTEVYVKTKKSYKLIAFIIILILLWGTAFTVDYYRTIKQGEKPIFMLLDATTAEKDDGSGYYRGLGYSVELSGDLSVDDDFQVKEASFKLLKYELGQYPEE